MDHEADRLLTTKEVQKLLGISRRHLYELRESGAVDCVHLGPRCQRYPLASIEALIARRLNKRPTRRRAVPVP